MKADPAGIEIDIDKINAEIGTMSEADLASALLKVRTQQKTQQKKMQGSEAHKAYQKKQQEKRKLMIAKAKELGIYDSINEQAEAAAKAKYETWLAANPPEAEAEAEEPEPETAPAQ